MSEAVDTHYAASSVPESVPSAHTSAVVALWVTTCFLQQRRQSANRGPWWPYAKLHASGPIKRHSIPLAKHFLEHPLPAQYPAYLSIDRRRR